MEDDVLPIKDCPSDNTLLVIVPSIPNFWSSLSVDVGIGDTGGAVISVSDEGLEEFIAGVEDGVFVEESDSFLFIFGLFINSLR